MKGIFYTEDLYSKSSGISKKILYQVEALKENNVDIKLINRRIKNNKINICVDGEILCQRKQTIIGKIKKKTDYSEVLNYIIKNNYDFIYIRYTQCSNPFFNKFLKKIKQNNIIVFLEIPTYPYDLEYKKSFTMNYFNFCLEKIFRNKMIKYIDKIVTFSQDSHIWGIDTIKISNGVSLEKNPIKNNRKSSKFNLIGVAGIEFWHGYDRVIKGLRGYYEKKSNTKKEVIFHIVGQGQGSEKKKLENLSKKLKIEDKVIFHGEKSGEELDKVFDCSDVAVGSLGRHRSGITQISTLKNREYCARGIPFIYSENDIDFDDKKFIFRIQPNEENVNIEDLIEFYEKLDYKKEEIRKHAKPLTWKNQIKKVVEELGLILSTL